MTRGGKIVGIAGAAAVVYGAWVRPRLMRWGATDEEVTGPYPGADLVSDGERGATMAVTIDAAPDQVWPWLVQLGGDLGGGTPGTTWTTPAAQVPKQSTRSGKTSPSATTSSTGRAAMASWMRGRLRRLNRIDSWDCAG